MFVEMTLYLKGSKFSEKKLAKLKANKPGRHLSEYFNIIFSSELSQTFIMKKLNFLIFTYIIILTLPLRLM